MAEAGIGFVRRAAEAATMVRFVWLALLGDVGSSVTAQAPEVGFRIRVNLVQIDADLTGSKGRHITDLRPEDFEILEDGRRWRIPVCGIKVLRRKSRKTLVSPR